MVHVVVQASKYLMMFLFLIYTFECFFVFHYKEGKGQKRIYRNQRSLMFIIHLDGFVLLYLTTSNYQVIGLYLMQVVILAALYVVYHKMYQYASELVLNNMCMLICIGMLIQTRLNFSKGFRQYIFLLAGALCAMLIPVILNHVSVFRKLTWVYAVVGIGAIGFVAIKGAVSYGAKLSIELFGFSFQPSEFVKILFVFYIAGMLREAWDLKQLFLTSCVSAVFVLILVVSNDLGGALLYFFTYLVMIYVASGHLSYFVAGSGFIALIGVLGNKLVSHVHNRVVAWIDPLSVYETQGNQVSNSLFAIGTGGWFGLGLGQGLPSKIPVVSNDFVFAAISEEMGGIFAFCLVMVCMSIFIMIFNVSMQMKDRFYKLVAVGLGSVYAMQVFLNIGGVIKFIPSTGVTLPLISYGGSSLLSTMLQFGIIQGLYIMHAHPNSKINRPEKS